MATVDWRLLGVAVTEWQKHPDRDPLKPYRDEAYTGKVPWGHYTDLSDSTNVGELLESMARTFTSTDQLHRIFTLMDEARYQGHMPQATAWAGEVLMRRARGGHGFPPLPDDWADQARVSYTGTRTSSGAYWAGAMLRAGGHHAPAPEIEQEGEGLG